MTTKKKVGRPGGVRPAGEHGIYIKLSSSSKEKLARLAMIYGSKSSAIEVLLEKVKVTVDVEINDTKE